MSNKISPITLSVYVVIANDYEKVKECIVFSDADKAMEFYSHCRKIYGGANVAFCSRRVDNVPENLMRCAENQT